MPTADVPPPPAAPAPAFAAVTQRFTVGSLMTRTFSVWRANFLSFSGVTLLLHSPVLVAILVLGAPLPGQEFALARGLVNLASALLGLVATGALTYGVIQSLAGKPARFGAMVGVGFSRLLIIFLVSLGVGFLMVLGLLLLVVPGFMVLCAFWLAVPVAVAEPDREKSAFERSSELTKGHRLTIFLVFLLYWVVAVSVGAFLGVVFLAVLGGGGAGATAMALGIEIVSVVVAGLLATTPAVAYHDLRQLKEGVSTADLAAVFA